MSWERSIVAWCDWMTAAGAPTTSIGLRRYHVQRVARELRTAPRSVSVDQLTAWLAGQDWSPNTRRAYRSSLRSFYGWALATGRVKSSPAHQLPPVKIPRPRPRPTPEEAFSDALRVADDRTRRALLLAGVCGLRRGEVAAVRGEHVERDLIGWSLRVKGKGGHVRLVPLPDDIAALLRASGPGWVFPSSHGGHLTPHHLAKLVSRHLPAGLTMHTLRHRCATVAYAATRDLRAVQELLGHAKPETTAIYTAVPDQAVLAAVASCAPGLAS
ncbi:tyrosine-type recombinase/integrase [Nocardioides sp.]|uniref:tyrosine-type recombinase/integrase n=1 Tax=Nocardioides sp. TaxID=35761 RepID=UPI00321B77CC